MRTSNDMSEANTNFTKAINLLQEKIMDYLLQGASSYTHQPQQVKRSVFITPPSNNYYVIRRQSS